MGCRTSQKLEEAVSHDKEKDNHPNRTWLFWTIHGGGFITNWGRCHSEKETRWQGSWTKRVPPISKASRDDSPKYIRKDKGSWSRSKSQNMNWRGDNQGTCWVLKDQGMHPYIIDLEDPPRRRRPNLRTSPQPTETVVVGSQPLELNPPIEIWLQERDNQARSPLTGKMKESWGSLKRGSKILKLRYRG